MFMLTLGLVATPQQALCRQYDDYIGLFKQTPVVANKGLMSRLKEKTERQCTHFKSLVRRALAMLSFRGKATVQPIALPFILPHQSLPITYHHGLLQNVAGHGLHCGFYALWHALNEINDRLVDPADKEPNLGFDNRISFNKFLPKWQRIVGIGRQWGWMAESGASVGLDHVTNLEGGELDYLVSKIFAGKGGLTNKRFVKQLHRHLCSYDRLHSVDDMVLHTSATDETPVPFNGHAIMRFKNSETPGFMVVVYNVSSDINKEASSTLSNKEAYSRSQAPGGVFQGTSHWVCAAIEKKMVKGTLTFDATYIDSLQSKSGARLIPHLAAMMTDPVLPSTRNDLVLRQQLAVVENFIAGIAPNDTVQHVAHVRAKALDVMARCTLLKSTFSPDAHTLTLFNQVQRRLSKA